MISLRNVSKIYASGVRAVDGLSLQVERGETVALLGESGCGKTTTLKMVNRLIERSSGEIRVDGSDVDQLDPVRLRRGIGYVFQGVGLFPHRSVADNVGVVPELLGWDRARIDARIDTLLELVDLAPASYRERFPHELSGGQMQRVGVARALAAEASVLLMDEPFGAVDPVTRDGLQRKLVDLRAELGLTILLVTHDVGEALLLGNRVAVLGEGRLLQVGTPMELFAAPACAEVARLLDTPRRQAESLHALVAAASDADTRAP